MSLDQNIVWDDALGTWVDGDTGEAIPQPRLTAEAFHHADEAQTNLENLTNALYAGLITLGEWQTAFALELQDGFVAQASFGVGGVSNLDDVAVATTSTLLGNQLSFLDGFAQDIAAGNVSQAQAITRANQYGNAIGQSYWEQWQRQQDSNEFRTLHNLNRIPQDGSTICRGNCRCFLEHADDGILWLLSAVENCDTCLNMFMGNPWAPML